jgi:hypothetical protein
VILPGSDPGGTRQRGTRRHEIHARCGKIHRPDPVVRERRLVIVSVRRHHRDNPFLAILSVARRDRRDHVVVRPGVAGGDHHECPGVIRSLDGSLQRRRAHAEVPAQIDDVGVLLDGEVDSGSAILRPRQVVGVEELHGHQPNARRSLRHREDGSREPGAVTVPVGHVTATRPVDASGAVCLPPVNRARPQVILQFGVIDHDARVDDGDGHRGR